MVLFHGVHAGAPLTLEAIKKLRSKYSIYAIDTIGQATKSEETVLNIKDDSFAIWADEVLEKLEIERANFIGISYGGFILQKLITHRPTRVAKCILVVPAGLANGNFWPSFTKLSIPLVRFLISKKDKDLRSFLKAFVHEDDTYMFEFQKAILLGVHMDYRKPAILKLSQVKGFKSPVYLMVADDEIFFPAEKTIQKAKEVFENLQEVYVLKDCKHMPHHSQFEEIQNKIDTWIKG